VGRADLGGAGPLRPTDAALAFQLVDLAPVTPPAGTLLDLRDIVRKCLGPDAERFERRVARWDGPDDAGAGGARPYAGKQLEFRLSDDARPISIDDLESVLRGTALLRVRSDGSRDFVLRDHHMLDVVLVHYATTGALPSRLFHADRHSDWCSDAFLNRRIPDQAATWWALLRGLKRPSDAGPVLEESDVVFTSERSAHAPWMSGRPFEEVLAVPWFVDRAKLHCTDATADDHAFDCDWVSLDLDDFLPSPQFRAARGLLEDARFRGMWRAAKVRVLCLSPQFTNGGDRHDRWAVAGRRSAMLRFVRLADALSR